MVRFLRLFKIREFFVFSPYIRKAVFRVYDPSGRLAGAYFYNLPNCR